MVLVNELGEVGIDHHLIEHAAESTLLLENGCLCCAMRDDLKDRAQGTALAAAPGARSHATSGSSSRRRGLPIRSPSPTPCWPRPVLQHHYRLGNVVTVVDAVNAPAQLDRFAESVMQVALADRLVVSKLDLARPRAPGGRCARGLPPSTRTRPIIDAGSPSLDPVELLITGVHDPQSKSREVERWLRSTQGAAPADEGPPPPASGRHRCLVPCVRHRARLDRVRCVDDDAAPSPWRSRAADEGAAERGGGPRSGARERRPAPRPPARAPGPMARTRIDGPGWW